MTISEQIDALKEAIATGALKIKHDNKETTFRSLEEMRQILRDLEMQNAGTKRVNVGYISFSRG